MYVLGLVFRREHLSTQNMIGKDIPVVYAKRSLAHFHGDPEKKETACSIWPEGSNIAHKNDREILAYQTMQGLKNED